MKASHYVDSPIGWLRLAEEDGAIIELAFATQAPAGKQAQAPNALLRVAAGQLEEYFAGRRKVFALPLRPVGTSFQRAVWEALCAIPYGETRSYAQIAAAVENPKAYRAVGMANNRNPIAIFIPCHRVVGADKKLVGYAGGLATKQQQLELEGWRG